MTTTSTAPTMMPNPIAGDAMHRGAEHLTPTGRDIFLVLASKRFATAEHVEERPERAGECGQDYEGPLEDRRLRGGPPDIDDDEQKRRNREDPLQEHDPVEHAEQTIAALVDRKGSRRTPRSIPVAQLG